jgi:hypothetical protein
MKNLWDEKLVAGKARCMKVSLQEKGKKTHFQVIGAGRQ